MKIELAVNGTLMRGLELNHNLLELGGISVRLKSYRTKSVHRKGDRLILKKSINNHNKTTRST